ncbi:MAG: ring-opening amidohydrolase [Bradyrhizobium sp.]|nr:ring-opening amidohydrolase [Bradyrhizobium sp.]
MQAVPVDPFFHQHLRNDVTPRVKKDYGVHVVVPEASEADAPVLLVFEGPDPADGPYQVPRTKPTDAEVKAFQQGIDDARKHILELLNKQESLTSTTLDVPAKFHEKLRRFIKKEQESRSSDQIPIRVTKVGTNITLRGPASAVESLAAKAEEFVEQAKEEEKERGFTLSFDFPQKYANHLIGKGGSNIKELRDRFDVEIQVQDGKVELKGPKAKAEAAQSGRLRGQRHTMLADSDIASTRHARAFVGGALAGLFGFTDLFVSGGAEHQGPDGGGPIAIIVERT